MDETNIWGNGVTEIYGYDAMLPKKNSIGGLVAGEDEVVVSTMRMKRRRYLLFIFYYTFYIIYVLIKSAL